jgi:hypothetical protein
MASGEYPVVVAMTAAITAARLAVAEAVAVSGAHAVAARCSSSP